MIYKFPYTDLYSLNLDWMIQAMKEMQAIVEPLDRVVNSVNNMTGDVVITKAFLLNILESMVSKFNGRAGDVTLTAADVNNTMIDITWTSDPGDVIGDIAQNVLDQLYSIGKRVLIFVNNQGVPDQIYFLTLVGDVVTPQIYSPTAALAGVASFNGQTGAVTATGSNLDTANDNDTPISESIEDLQTAVSHQSQQIDELDENLSGRIDNLETDISLISDGDVHPAINPNQYVIVKNHSTLTDGLYFNKTASVISASTALTTNNLERVEIGGLNHLLETRFKLLRTVTADGSRTYNSLISELFSGISADNEKYIIIGNDDRVFHCVSKRTGEFVQFSATDVGMSNMIIRIISRYYSGYYEANGSLSLTSYTTSVVTSGNTLKLIKIC